MKFDLVFILFVITAFSVFKVMVIESAEPQPVFDFPELATPDVEFIDVSGGCSSFFDCTEYVGAVMFNIGAGIIFIVLFVIDLLVYLFDLFAIFIAVQFTGITGAPFWINTLLVLPFLASLAFIFYKLIRRGSSNA